MTGKKRTKFVSLQKAHHVSQENLYLPVCVYILDGLFVLGYSDLSLSPCFSLLAQYHYISLIS